MKFIKDLDLSNIKIDPEVDRQYQSPMRSKLEDRFCDVHYYRSRPGWELFVIGSATKKNAKLGRDFLLFWHNMGSKEVPELSRVKFVLIIPNSGEIKNQGSGQLRVSKYQEYSQDAILMLHSWLLTVEGYIKKNYPKFLI